MKWFNGKFNFFSLFKSVFCYRGTDQKTLDQKGNEKLHFAWRALHIFVLFPYEILPLLTFISISLSRGIKTSHGDFLN